MGADSPLPNSADEKGIHAGSTASSISRDSLEKSATHSVLATKSEKQPTEKTIAMEKEMTTQHAEPQGALAEDEVEYPK